MPATKFLKVKLALSNGVQKFGFNFSNLASLISDSRGIWLCQGNADPLFCLFISNDYLSCWGWGQTAENRAGFSPLVTQISSKVSCVFSDFKSLGNSKYGLYGIFFFLLCKTRKVYLGVLLLRLWKQRKLIIFINPFTPKSGKWHFTLSNARRFYSSMENPLRVKGLKLKRFLLALSGKTLLVTVKEITK